MNDVLKVLKALAKTKTAQKKLQQLSSAIKNRLLYSFAENLARYKKEILSANSKDVKFARQKGCNSAFINRLALTEKRVREMASAVCKIARLEDPIGKLIEKRKLTNGVELQKISVPLGTIGIIYESRPNVTIDAAALCLKSGNAVVLKGGSESLNSNKALIKIIHKSLKEHRLPAETVVFLDTTDRAIVQWLLQQDRYIDVVIPRGGYDLVRTVVKQSTIPVLYHAEGGARIYIDESADVDLAIKIAINAKTNRPATCNSLDTLIIHEDIAAAFLPRIVAVFKKHNVSIMGDRRACAMVKIEKATAKDWQTEFLSLKVAIKIVDNLDEALSFISRYTKNHSEGIIAQDETVVKQFVNSVDAAALFINCSTRLHDGGIFGLGAEMGIATGKLHARGPVGLRELITYKWIAYGNGQVRKNSR